MRAIFYKNKNNTLTSSTTAVSSFGALNYAKEWQGFSVFKDMMVELDGQLYNSNTRRKIYKIVVPVN